MSNTIINPFAYRQLAECFILEIPCDLGDDVFADMSLRSRVVEKATCDLLNGTIDPLDFCDLVEGVIPTNMDAYLDEVSDNLCHLVTA